MTASTPAIATVFGLLAACSLAASAVLVVRLERLGVLFGLSEAALGLVAALAADGPEITSAVTALAQGQHDVGVGVLLGSNVFNLAALLGLSAVLARRIPLHRAVVTLEGVVALWIAALTVATVDRRIDVGLALVLVLLVFVPYVVLAWIQPARRPAVPLPGRWRRWLSGAVRDEEIELAPAVEHRPGSPRDAWIAGAALLVVVVASAAMERAATTLGVRLAIPSIVVGAVILAAVTSLPNAVAAVYLSRRGRASATLSEAMNSNTLNVVAGLFVPALIVGLGSPSGEAVFVAICYAGLTLVTLTIAFVRRGIGRVAGAVVIALYLGFVIVLVTR